MKNRQCHRCLVRAVYYEQKSVNTTVIKKKKERKVKMRLGRKKPSMCIYMLPGGTF